MQRRSRQRKNKPGDDQPRGEFFRSFS
jgi:hypothetical protein